MTAKYIGAREPGSGLMQGARQVWKKVKGGLELRAMSRKWFKWRTLGWKLLFFFKFNFHLKMSPHDPVTKTQFNLKIYLKELFESLVLYSCSLCIFVVYDVLGCMMVLGTLWQKSKCGPTLPSCSCQPLGNTHIHPVFTDIFDFKLINAIYAF